MQSEDTVKRAAQYKKSSFNKCNTLKSTYDSKCRDADRADEHNSRLHSNPQAKAKELAQCAKKMEVGDGGMVSAVQCNLTYPSLHLSRLPN